MRFNTTFKPEVPVKLPANSSGTITFSIEAPNVTLTARRTLTVKQEMTLDPDKVYVAVPVNPGSGSREFLIREVRRDQEA